MASRNAGFSAIAADPPACSATTAPSSCARSEPAPAGTSFTAGTWSRGGATVPAVDPGTDGSFGGGPGTDAAAEAGPATGPMIVPPVVASASSPAASAAVPRRRPTVRHPEPRPLASAIANPSP